MRLTDNNGNGSLFDKCRRNNKINNDDFMLYLNTVDPEFVDARMVVVFKHLVSLIPYTTKLYESMSIGYSSFDGHIGNNTCHEYKFFKSSIMLDLQASLIGRNYMSLTEPFKNIFKKKFDVFLKTYGMVSTADIYDAVVIAQVPHP